eukprot:5119982-Amphidinium_carterae.1
MKGVPILGTLSLKQLSTKLSEVVHKVQEATQQLHSVPMWTWQWLKAASKLKCARPSKTSGVKTSIPGWPVASQATRWTVRFLNIAGIPVACGA